MNDEAESLIILANNDEFRNFEALGKVKKTFRGFDDGSFSLKRT